MVLMRPFFEEPWRRHMAFAIETEMREERIFILEDVDLLFGARINLEVEVIKERNLR